MKNLKAIKKISVTFFITIFLINILCINLSAENIKYKKGGILYKYDAATASKDWTVFNRGKWTFGTDGISVENNDNRTGNDAWYYTYFGAKNGWKNYVIECDMENVSECAILFRITDPTDKSVDAFGGYSCGYDSSFMFMGKDDNDKWLTLAESGEDASAQYKIGYKPNMHWTLYVYGNTFTLYLDDAKFATMQCVDKDSTYTSGGIGVRFRTYVGDYSGKIKNITVSELKTVSDGNSEDKNSKNATPGTVSDKGKDKDKDKDKAVPNTSVNDGSISETSSIIDSDAELPDNDSYTNTSGKDVVEVNNVSTEIPIWIIVLICVLLAIMIAIPVVFAVFLHMNKKQGLTPKK